MSSGSGPAMASSVRAASATVLPKVPTVSCVSDIGTTPARDVSPTVGLLENVSHRVSGRSVISAYIPTIPSTIAGLITLQSVSVPTAIGTKFEVTATALPPLEP